MDDRELYSGFIHLHILHHASEGPVFGLWIIEELAQHGYKLSPGTIYPILHNMEAKGYLISSREVFKGKMRRLYRITPQGSESFESAKVKISELFGELFQK